MKMSRLEEKQSALLRDCVSPCNIIGPRYPIYSVYATHPLPFISRASYSVLSSTQVYKTTSTQIRTLCVTY
jgi:hypothetical protein